MTLVAVLRNGTRVQIDPAHGRTVQELVTGLTAGSLTGSAVPLADAMVRLVDGREVGYTSISLIEQTDSFDGR